MFKVIKEKLFEKDDHYIILENGRIVEKSNDDLGLDFSKNSEVYIVHIINQDTTINYRINSNLNVKISEVFYSVENSPEVVINFKIDESAKVDYLSFRKTEGENQIKANVNANLEGNAYLNYKTLTNHIGDVVVKEDFLLNGEDADLDIKNVLISTSGSKQRFDINIHHNAQSTRSHLLNFGIAKNESTLEINSKGLIVRGAHKAAINQRAKGLLLDEQSVLSANPLLEIDDFDVIANHGASIGAIDEDELYYLMSRGILKDEAEKIIISGFVNPVIREIDEGKFQDYILDWTNLN